MYVHQLAFVPFEVPVTGNDRIYVATLQARNSIGTGNITTYSGIIPGNTKLVIIILIN